MPQIYIYNKTIESVAGWPHSLIYYGVVRVTRSECSDRQRLWMNWMELFDRY